jgi:hypothetical protein
MKHIKGNPKLKRYLRLRGLPYSNKRLIEVKDEVIESQAKIIACQSEKIHQLEKILANREDVINEQKKLIDIVEQDFDACKQSANILSQLLGNSSKVIDSFKKSIELDKKLKSINKSNSSKYKTPVYRLWLVWFFLNEVRKHYNKPPIPVKVLFINAEESTGISWSQFLRVKKQLEIWKDTDEGKKIVKSFFQIAIKMLGVAIIAKKSKCHITDMTPAI